MSEKEMSNETLEDLMSDFMKAKGNSSKRKIVLDIMLKKFRTIEDQKTIFLETERDSDEEALVVEAMLEIAKTPEEYLEVYKTCHRKDIKTRKSVAEGLEVFDKKEIIRVLLERA